MVTNIERFNKHIYLETQNETNVISEAVTAINPTEELLSCKKCGNPCTHISSEFGRESCLCDQCAELFIEKRKQIPSDMWFCKTLNQVIELDATKIQLPPKETVRKARAVELFYEFIRGLDSETKSKLLELLEIHEPIIFNILVSGCECCDARVEEVSPITFALLCEKLEFHEFAESVKREWDNDYLLSIFFNESGEAMYDKFLELKTIKELLANQ